MLGVAFEVGEVLVVLVGVTLLAVDEVVETVEETVEVDDDDDCVVLDDGLIFAFVGEEPSREDVAADESPLFVLSFESLPQDSGSVGAFIRS